MAEIKEEDLYCPITHQLFNDPVFASDGFIYERSAIVKHFESNYTSPITRETITNNVYPCHIMKCMISSFLEKNPDKKSDQYKEIKSFSSVAELKSSIDKYDIIDISKMSHNEIIDLVKDDIVIKVIDKVDDLNKKYRSETRLIHYICANSTFEVVKYIVEKGVDLECEADDTSRPIHSACKYANIDTILFLINKGVNIDCPNRQGCYPIDYIVSNDKLKKDIAQFYWTNYILPRIEK